MAEFSSTRLGVHGHRAEIYARYTNIAVGVVNGRVRILDIVGEVSGRGIATLRAREVHFSIRDALTQLQEFRDLQQAFAVPQSQGRARRNRLYTRSDFAFEKPTRQVLLPELEAPKKEKEPTTQVLPELEAPKKKEREKQDFEGSHPSVNIEVEKDEGEVEKVEAEMEEVTEKQKQALENVQLAINERVVPALMEQAREKEQHKAVVEHVGRHGGVGVRPHERAQDRAREDRGRGVGVGSQKSEERERALQHKSAEKAVREERRKERAAKRAKEAHRKLDEREAKKSYRTGEALGQVEKHQKTKKKG